MKRMSTVAAVVLVCISILALAGCGTKTSSPGWTPNPTEVKPFTTCGFSFEYPKDFSIWQQGLLDAQANENSGIVQVAPGEGQLPLFAVTWVKTWQWGLEGGLEVGFAGVENWEGIESIEKGDLVETTLTAHRMLFQARHRMLRQPYTATTGNGDGKVYGVVGALYCEETQRQFGLVTMEDSGSSAQQALDNFEAYLDSFTCH